MAVVVSKTNRVAMTVVVRFCGVDGATESTDDGAFSRVNTNHEDRERNQKRVCSSNSKRSPNQWSPMEKKEKVVRVSSVPRKNHFLDASRSFRIS